MAQRWAGGTGRGRYRKPTSVPDTILRVCGPFLGENVTLLTLFKRGLGWISSVPKVPTGGDDAEIRPAKVKGMGLAGWYPDENHHPFA